MEEKNDKSLRDEILETSLELVLDEGYSNLSMRKIARKVGISATSIYLYFENKDDLVHRLMELSIDELNRELHSTFQEVGDPVERLEALARSYVRFALYHPDHYQIIYQVNSDHMQRYPKEKFRKARKGYELLTKTIEEAVQKDRMDEDNPRLASYIFWAQLHGVMSVLLTERLDIRIDRDEFIDQAIEHIIQGFHARTEVSM